MGRARVYPSKKERDHFYWIKYREKHGCYTEIICPICGKVFRLGTGQNKGTVCRDCLPVRCSSCGRETSRKTVGLCRNCYSEQRYKSDPERYKSESAVYRIQYPERIKAMTARYQKENHGEIMARAKLSELMLRLETFDTYGGKCVLCGESGQEFLCLDHVGNNGKGDRELYGGGRHLYRSLRKQGYPRNGYRVLCYNCNMARMLEEKMSVPQRPAQVKYTRKVKAEMVEAYGGKCVCCGENNLLLLALDHVNGGGQVDRAVNGRGRVMYARLKKLGYPKDDYRLLCHNCNMSLGFFGYCPHGGLK